MRRSTRIERDLDRLRFLPCRMLPMRRLQGEIVDDRGPFQDRCSFVLPSLLCSRNQPYSRGKRRQLAWSRTNRYAMNGDRELKLKRDSQCDQRWSISIIYYFCVCMVRVLETWLDYVLHSMRLFLLNFMMLLCLETWSRKMSVLYPVIIGW